MAKNKPENDEYDVYSELNHVSNASLDLSY